MVIAGEAQRGGQGNGEQRLPSVLKAACHVGNGENGVQKTQAEHCLHVALQLSITICLVNSQHNNMPPLRHLTLLASSYFYLKHKASFFTIHMLLLICWVLAPG